MRARQVYQTLVEDRDTELAAEFWIAPRRAFESPELADPARVSNVLQPSIARKTHDDSVLPVVLTMVLASREPEAILRGPAADDWRLAFGAAGDSAARTFATWLVSAEVVPWEASPLKLTSLAKIIEASATGGGGIVGFLIAGPSPLAFLTVPAGMIVFGAAAGLAKGLQYGLRYGLAAGLSTGLAARLHRALTGDQAPHALSNEAGRSAIAGGSDRPELPSG